MATAQRDIVRGPIELKGQPLPELEQLFLEHGERKYRAKQVYDALYIQRVPGVEDIVQLPQPLREKLSSEFRTKSTPLMGQRSSYSTFGTAGLWRVC
jgi:23S rRNA (adenine2503-C2)-methyltransferase